MKSTSLIAILLAGVSTFEGAEAVNIRGREIFGRAYGKKQQVCSQVSLTKVATTIRTTTTVTTHCGPRPTGNCRTTTKTSDSWKTSTACSGQGYRKVCSTIIYNNPTCNFDVVCNGSTVPPSSTTSSGYTVNSVSSTSAGSSSSSAPGGSSTSSAPGGSSTSSVPGGSSSSSAPGGSSSSSAPAGSSTSSAPG
ncbi:hypothetical protein H072_6540, partial [Dactylellina haptotyla CBS 200.50]